jgi:hypothetical protein
MTIEKDFLAAGIRRPWREQPADGVQPADPEISLYENQIPACIESELDLLYGALYSSLSYFRCRTDMAGTSTYVARRGGRISAIFLFRREEDGTIRVLNEGMRLPADEVRRFAHYLFASSPGVGAIAFHAVQIDEGPLPWPHQRFFCTEDFIADLPDSADAYLARLGSATRKNLKRHRNRLERDFPSFRHEVREKQDVDEAQVRAIIKMNRVRMMSKNKVSFIDEEETQHILRLVRECGMVCAVTIDGHLCAGAIVFHVGRSFISKVNAHDMRYDDYRLGMLSCYLAVCEAIARGATRFHFGHGKYEYKSALLGEFQGYDHLALYRSPWHLLRHCGMAWRTARDGWRMKLSLWLQHKLENETGWGWDAARKARERLRERRRRRTSASAGSEEKA